MGPRGGAANRTDEPALTPVGIDLQFRACDGGAAMMSEPDRSQGDLSRRQEERRPWVTPRVRDMRAGRAEFAGEVNEDGSGLS